MKILLIDNGTTLLKKLEDLLPGAEIVKKSSDVVPEDAAAFDLIVLSGSASSSVVWDYKNFEREIALIRESNKPIIGICFGCELIAHAFGGELAELSEAHTGVREIEILDPHFFLKSPIKVYEHHRWIISKMPQDFAILAQSKDGPEAIRHKTRPVYGLQFHPENFVEETEGNEVFLTLFSILHNPQKLA